MQKVELKEEDIAEQMTSKFFDK